MQKWLSGASGLIVPRSRLGQAWPDTRPWRDSGFWKGEGKRVAIELIGPRDPEAVWVAKINSVIDYFSGSGTAAGLATRGAVRAAINAIAAELALEAFGNGDYWGDVRPAINAIISALDIPVGADLYQDYQAGRYYGAPAPVDTHATNILVPNAAGVYETFAPDVLVRNGKGVWTFPTRQNEVGNIVADLATGWSNTGNVTTSMLDLNALGLFKGLLVTSTGTNVFGRVTSLQNIPVISGQPQAVKVWCQLGTSGQLMVQLTAGGAGNMQVQGVPGALSTRGALNIGSITNISDKLLEDGVSYEVTFIYTPNADLNIDVGVGPNSATVGHTVIVLGAMVESNSLFSTTPILTAGAATQRPGNSPKIDVTGKLSNGFCFVTLMKNQSLLQTSTRFMVASDGTTPGWTGLAGSASGVLRLAGNNNGVNFGTNAPTPNSQSEVMAIVQAVEPNGHLHGYFVTAYGTSEADVAGGITPDQFTMFALGGLGFSNTVNHYAAFENLVGFYDFTHYAEAKALADALYAEAAA